jgi:hypothetical protein
MSTAVCSRVLENVCACTSHLALYALTYHGTVFALLISLGQATVYVLTGLYGQPGDLGAGVCLLLNIQLVAAALIVILLDELLRVFTHNYQYGPWT